MRVDSLKYALVGVAIAVFSAGCANKSSSDKSKYANRGDSKMYAANTYGIDENDAFDGRNVSAQEQDLLAVRKFNFDFDRDDIKAQYYPSLTAHAEYLKNNPNKTIRVEGYTDEQGSREYNVGLGERRGNAVTHFLIANGASPRQINVVSYGPEKPEMRGSNEDAYRANRRALIIYEQ